MNSKKTSAENIEHVPLRDRAQRYFLSHPRIAKIARSWQIYLMLLPVFLGLIVFSYVPMYGIVIAFKDYLPSRGILGSESVGFKHFEELLSDPFFPRAVRNTLTISSLNLVFSFPVPVILALLLNEFRHARFKKWIQTAIYLPNFISWVIIGEFARQLFQPDGGIVNNIIKACGGTPINFLTSSEWFYPILIILGNWKGSGYGTIIYLAALSGIDPNLYEAARIDGASRARMMWSISVPVILPIVIVMLLMQVGNIMNAGFDPIFNLYTKAVYNVADIIDTLVYRRGLLENRYEMSTAVGLFKNVINFILLMLANYFSKKISGYSMYSFE